MSSPEKPLSFMLVCGEPSGDQLGAQLMAGLKSLTGDTVQITGVGGAAMTAEGLKSLFPLDDTAVMGLREVVPKIPKILKRAREAADFALATRPDAVVLIDSPDFTHRIAQRLKKIDPSIKTVNYVAPQVWASRSYRAKKMARYFDLVLALLPFEVPFFEKYGLHTVFAGHPVIERASRMTGGDALREKLGIPKDAKLLALLPGSRTNEVRFLLPIYREAVRLITQRVSGLVTILPTMPHVAARVRQGTKDWPTPLHIVESDDEKFAAFDAADVALATSGTVTTELALSRTPMVSAYRVGALTYALAWLLFDIKYFTLINLLLDRGVIPEFLQSRATPKALSDAVIELLTNPEVAARQVEALSEAMQLLGQDGEKPSLRAASILIDFAQKNRR
ncbi:MAG TPA: lipid-A-disaccharide synthase [Rhizomicrobium sp.]|jgi:lipid-A-disaccharide synthase|nr:lipid-A-disaccharide synthase [Rhizomicrobium sp.]